MTIKRLRWGVLGVSSIANEMVPAINAGTTGTVTAIASRTEAKAREAASRLGIPKWFGSYGDLLADPSLDIIYVSLPNHLHVEWALAAIRARKNVVVEKPAALTGAEAILLAEASEEQKVCAAEAFTFRSHPQWKRVRELLNGGAIGPVRALIGRFSYANANPGDIRNQVKCGGGALMDVGCYLTNCCLSVFGQVPSSVVASSQMDEKFGTDILSSAVLSFDEGHAIITCGTQSSCTQGVEIVGTEGRIWLDTPFNAPPSVSASLSVGGGSFFDGKTFVEHFAGHNQQTIYADVFGHAVSGVGQLPMSLDESIRNARVLEAIRRSAETGSSVAPAADGLGEADALRRRGS